MTHHRPLDDDGPALEPIAIIGMACRLPGADDLDQYWRNLRDGVESIRAFSKDQALDAGASRRAVDDPQHVRAAPILDAVEDFDAARFGFTRREAELLDPQHRVFLECAAAALDHAGYDPARYDGEIGVYGGVGAGEYQWYHLLADKKLVAAVGHMAIALANNPDYVATLTSYKLNLRGPSLSVSTACSTGLVAVHLAAEAVRNGECDMALAGAASVELTQWHGYVFQEGGILSPDGHCRAFDADAAGTLWGSGGAMVVLKRLSDAVADGDTVHAVILGSAVNNDGSDKVGFSAPSVSGQTAVIRQALGVAGADPVGIDYIEAHGTGTKVGDPIEVRALTNVLGQVREPGAIRLGTVKPNIGHLAAAAGVAGLIKTVLSLENGTIPATLHFTRPNPAMNLEQTPLRVVSTPEPWRRGERPRRAGVSSFGMGGTNAHAVVEEAPAQPTRPDSGRPQVLVLSAQTSSALETMGAELSERLRTSSELSLDDVAYTLQVGRGLHPYRMAVVATDRADAAQVLAGSAPRRLHVGRAPVTPRTAFLLPGQGTQRVGMARELYEQSPIVREWIDKGAVLLQPMLRDLDLREVLFASGEDAAHAAEQLRRTALTQPALFVVEYALARLWESLGVRPDAMLGHSLGEYVACCLAGVFSFEDGLRIVASRAALMDSMPPGAMLSVPLDEPSLELDGTGLQLAAVNAQMACVVSGPIERIEAYEAALLEEGVPVTRLRTSHAFHSQMMEPMREALAAVLAGVDLHPPAIPVVSNLTGGWLSAEQATDAGYWVEHMCRPVHFSQGLETLLSDGPSVLLEVGPGQVLSGLARMQLPATTPDPVATLPSDAAGEAAFLLDAAARLWTLGVAVDFTPTRSAHRRRVPLPGHPFERQRCWIDSDAPVGTVPALEPATHEGGPEAMDDWFWVPGWHQAPRLAAPTGELDAGPWLVLRDAEGSLDELVTRLRSAGATVVTATAGASYADGGTAYSLRADQPDDFERLLDRLSESGLAPTRVVHAWALDIPAEPLAVDAAPGAVDGAFFSLLFLTQALAARGLTDGVELLVVSRGAAAVTGDDVTTPLGALVTGAVKVLPSELEGIRCRRIDVDDPRRVAESVLEELAAEDELVAYRRGRRWLPEVQRTAVADTAAERAALRERGVYVITGGLGGIGLTLAEDLARRFAARLVLVGRSPLPPRDQWSDVASRGGRLARQVAAVRRLEALGSEVLVVSADVTDAAGAVTVRDLALDRFGDVHGVIHAAGVAGGTMVEAQDAATASAVLSPKVFGTLHLASAFRDVPLDFLALFSSVTSLLGGLGQLDYCAANAFLDAFAAAEPRLPWPVLALNWGAWLEVGMAVETVAPSAFRALERGATRHPIEHPLLDAIEVSDGGREVVGVVDLDVQRHWVLDEHRILGMPTLPGTSYLEMVRATFTRGDAERPVELREVVFLAPLSVAEGGQRTVRVVIEDGVDGGAWRVESWTDGVRQEHARGSVSPASRTPMPVIDLDAVRARTPSVTTAGQLQDSASGLLSFGGRWSSLQEVRTGRGEELALLSAGTQTAAELAGWALHPAMLDEATSFGTYDGATGSYLPLGYGRVTVRRRMPARFYSYLRHRDGATGELLTSDILLLDEQGDVIAELADFLLRQVDGAMLSLDAAPAGPREDEVSSGQVGIRPRDGAEAFARALGSGLGPQLVITARDLRTLQAKVRETDRDRLTEELGQQVVADGGVVALEGEYVAPTSDLERALVELWEASLGVRGIGIEHDFFALGGNSLAASQLIARVRASMGVKLPMRVLFESPTIAAMAAMIEASADIAS